jgi:hypothetical protein
VGRRVYIVYFEKNTIERKIEDLMAAIKKFLKVLYNNVLVID